VRQCWCRDVNICKTLVLFWPVEVQEDRFRPIKIWNRSSRREGHYVCHTGRGAGTIERTRGKLTRVVEYERRACVLGSNSGTSGLEVLDVVGCRCHCRCAAGGHWRKIKLHVRQLAPDPRSRHRALKLLQLFTFVAASIAIVYVLAISENSLGQ
jgi:hypothetical protein